MFENISIEECQIILNKASDSSLHEENHDNDEFAEAVDIIQTLSNKISDVVSSKELMLKCTAACIWILKTSCNVEDCIRAFTFYLNLMKSPVFGSLGCRSLGIRKFILMCFSRVITKTLKGTNELSTTLRVDISEDLEEMDNDEIAIEVTSDTLSQRSRRAAAQKQVSTKKSKSMSFSKSYLQTFMQSFNAGLPLLLENADEDFVSTVAEFLVLLLQIVHFSEEWKSSSQAISQLFQSFSCFSSETVLAMHQCIMPGLSYCFDRSAIYSDSAKLRASVHHSLVEIYSTVVVHLINTVYQTQFSRKNSSVANVSFESTSASTTPAKSRRGTPKSTPGSAKSVRSINSSRMDADDEEETNVAGEQPTVKEFSTGPECLLSSLQRMTLLCPDRANVRQIVAKSISIVMTAIVNDANRTVTNKVMSHYIHFLTRLARSNRAQHRSFALEIICNMIQDEIIWKSGLDARDLLLVLIARCADQSPVVRLKALSTLFDFMDNSDDPARLQTLHELVISPNASLLDTVRLLASEVKPMLRAKALQVLTCILTKEWIKSAEVTELQNNGRSADKENYFYLPLADDDVQVIANACQDASIAVRKQAVHCLTEILKTHPTSITAMTTWVTVALPLIIDSESSVVQKVASVFEDVVLSGLTEDTTTAELSLGWKLLYKIGELNMVQILKHIIGYMIRNGNIVFERNANMSFYRLINMCKVHCEAGLARPGETPLENGEGNNTQDHCYSEASWILLESFASHCGMKVNNAKGQLISVEEQFQKVGSTKFIFESFRLNCLNQVTNEDNYVRILKVLDKFLSTFSDDELSFVASEIKTRLMSLSIQAPVAALMISIQFQISKLRAEQSRAIGVTIHVNAWVTPLLEKIFQQLKTFAFGQQNPFDPNASVMNTTTLSQQDTSADELSQQHTSSMINTMRMTQIGLFIVGELSMLGFKLDETPMKLLMKSSAENDTTPLVTITEDAMGAIRVRFAARLSELLQLFMAKTLPGSDGRGHLRCPNPIRAVAFITVGKLCMRDHVLARDSLNVFLRELTVNDDDDVLNVSQNEVSLSALSEQSFLTQTATKNSVRNNALLVLSDLCVRHTHLVDRHIDTLACCLQDRDPMIRKNALMLISQLLMQDFVKLKGLLLYRFLMLTVDEDEELAMFATEVIERSLCLKYPGILVNHFSEAFIILNKCSEHPIYSAVAFAAGQDNNASNGTSGMVDDHAFTQAFAMDSTLEMDPNTKAFHASTDLSRAQRFHVYNFMATNINDETKIQITAKLVNDILSSAVDHSQRLLPDRNNVAISHSAMKKYGNNQRDSLGGVASSNVRSLVDFTRFEVAIEDVLIFLRSPVLKIGSKKKHGADSQDDGLLEDGAEGASSTAGQIAQAKTKILKALSSQHMISHVLPVVMSLKHVLEQLKSPLQGALMEYLLSLVKHHASEVDQALQYDPTLKAEIDFDLRQFERQRKEQQQMKQNQQLTRGGPASAMKRLLSNASTPQVDRVAPASSIRRTSMSKTLLPSTVQKPVLKSAHKSGGMSAKLGGGRTPGSVRFHESTQAGDDEDPMLRLMSQPEDIAAEEYISSSGNTNMDNISAISNRLSMASALGEDHDLSHISLVSEADTDARRMSNGNPKRRSWGVVLAQQLTTSASKGNNDVSSIVDSFVSEQPERKRSRPNSRGNSFGDILTVEKSLSGKMEQPIFMKMKTSSLTRKESSENLDTTNSSVLGENNVNSTDNNLPKRLESIFATAEVTQNSSVIMPPPAPVAGGKRSAKVASNSLLMGMR